MKEQIFQTMWRNYINLFPPKEPENWELKIIKLEKQKAFAFNRVAEHQLEGLKQAQFGLFHKISDAPIFSGMKTRFTWTKPFDCLWIIGKSFVVILWYYPHKIKLVHKIPLEVFENLVKTWKRKSIHMDELSQIDGVETIDFSVLHL